MKMAVSGIVGVTMMFALYMGTVHAQVTGDAHEIKLLMSRAEKYFNDNMLDSALACCNMALGYESGDCRLYDLRGVVYTKMQKYGKAIKDFKKAIALDSACYEVYNHLGIVYLCRNELGLAIECFNRAVELNPNYAKAYYNRGIAHHYQQDTDEALADMKKAAELKHSEAIQFLSQIN